VLTKCFLHKLPRRQYVFASGKPHIYKGVSTTKRQIAATLPVDFSESRFVFKCIL
jgi:hypothetical protein